jgi:hypothetical protein
MKCKVLFKEVRKIPKGVTILYGIEWNFDMGSTENVLYSKTISNSGKVSIYADYAFHWKNRKYKDYTDINSNRLSKSVYEDMQKAIKVYEDQQNFV